MLQPLPMAQLHGHYFHGDSSSDSDSDSDLSTIHEAYNEQEEALDEGLPPHLHLAAAG